MRMTTCRLGAFLALTGTPAMAIDSCLIGTWQADLDDLGHIMATQMNGEARVAGGAVTMEIKPDDSLTILVENLVFNVQVPDVPPMDVTVTGYSNAGFSAEDGTWTASNTDYDLVGSANVLGQTMTIPFTSDTGMFGGGLGTYGCTADSVSFESTGDTPRMPRKWVRVD